MGTSPLLMLEQLNRLRLVVAVPESQVGGIVKNARVPFTLPAFPGGNFLRHGKPDRSRSGPEDAHDGGRT